METWSSAALMAAHSSIVCDRSFLSLGEAAAIAPSLATAKDGYKPKDDTRPNPRAIRLLTARPSSLRALRRRGRGDSSLVSARRAQGFETALGRAVARSDLPRPTVLLIGSTCPSSTALILSRKVRKTRRTEVLSQNRTTEGSYKEDGDKEREMDLVVMSNPFHFIHIRRPSLP